MSSLTSALWGQPGGPGIVTTHRLPLLAAAAAWALAAIAVALLLPRLRLALALVLPPLLFLSYFSLIPYPEAGKLQFSPRAFEYAASASSLGLLGILVPWALSRSRLVSGNVSPAVQVLSKILFGPRFTRGLARWAPWIALVLGLGAMLVFQSRVLARIPHVADAIAMLFQAKVFARGMLTAPIPPEPSFFDYWGVFPYRGRWATLYPPGFPALLALGLLLGVPWLVNPVLSVLLLAATFLAARRMFGTITARWALLLGALSPWWIVMGASWMSHVASALFAVIGIAFFAHTNEGRRGPAFLAGVAFGLACGVRPIDGLMVGAPFGAMALWRAARSPRRDLSVAAAMALGTALGLSLTLVWNATVFGHPLRFGYDAFAGEPLRLGFGKIPEKYARYFLFGPARHTPIAGLSRVAGEALGLQASTFGWLAPGLFLAIVHFFLGRPRALDWTLLAAVGLILLGSMFYPFRTAAFGPRWSYVALPALLILSARGLGTLSALGAGRRFVVAFLGLNLVWTAAVFSPRAWREFTPEYLGMDRTLERVADTYVMPGSLVFMSTLMRGFEGNPFFYGSGFRLNAPDLSGTLYLVDQGRDADLLFARRFPARPVYHFIVHYRGVIPKTNLEHWWLYKETGGTGPEIVAQGEALR